jgi:ABC-2 type transport system permease protein
VWFRSIFGKTLRDCRVPILGWGVGLGVMAPLILVLSSPLLADQESRNAIEALVRHPAIRMFAEPIDVLSPAGYMTWRLSMILPLLSIWALLSVTRMLRGEEESGSLDLLLSMPRSRLHVAAAKLAAVAVALVLIGSTIGSLAWAGAWLGGAPVALPAALLFGLNASLLAGVFGACALVVSQFTGGRRTAAGITGVLYGLSVLMTIAGRTLPRSEWIGRLSPIYYFEQSKPLVASVGTRPVAVTVLGVLTLALAGAGIVLFNRRDAGGVIAIPLDLGSRVAVRPPSSRSWQLSSVFARSVGSLTGAAASWGLSLALYAAAITAILQIAQKNLIDLIERVAATAPMLAGVIARLTGGQDAEMNARSLTAIFTMLAVVVAAFAVSLASRWASDEEEGRLDLLLAAPHARELVILARFSALTIAVVAVTGAIFVSVGVTAALGHYSLNRARLAQAAFGIVPIAVLVAATGYLLSGWLRSATVTGTLIALILGSFMVTLLGSVFRWPPYVMRLSIFEQYGTPLVDGLHPTRVLGLLAMSALILAAATRRFATKDLVR